MWDMVVVVVSDVKSPWQHYGALASEDQRGGAWDGTSVRGEGPVQRGHVLKRGRCVVEVIGVTPVDHAVNVAQAKPQAGQDVAAESNEHEHFDELQQALVHLNVLCLLLEEGA